ncbi:hypothetical protein BpHYR1_002306 [Brachionus plicatilis]|uniref:Uncharacterized protein n=1 Tax=Brachionus plicatilis TaxID=10195 RepID=A0A3M7RUG8_BRAPC|nr:hypothetical protein BpHYR1_002306 [Brachionus plicatilis]
MDLLEFLIIKLNSWVVRIAMVLLKTTNTLVSIYLNFKTQEIAEYVKSKNNIVHTTWMDNEI